MVFLFLALGLALAFEFVNGFHDTANAVATVIYTHTLKPTYAVIWSGCWNLIGVLTSSGMVAFSILALLPVELVLNVGSGAGFAMVFSLLISAIIWNVGTWYFGLPASSSHTLIGSIMGVGLANSLFAKGYVFGEGVNWAKAKDVGMALLVSPLVGFFCTALLFWLMRAIIKSPELYKSPEGKVPPLWIRALLVLTCTGVSFSHGSNDGQKGMGLIVLILVGIVPAGFALNLQTSAGTLTKIRSSATSFEQSMQKTGVTPARGSVDSANRTLTTYLRKGEINPATMPALETVNHRVMTGLAGVNDLASVPGAERRTLRLNIYLVSETLAKMIKAKKLPAGYDADALSSYQKALKGVTSFIPVWVKVAIALALGLGTMIGLKRIVVTVGEKIGKARLTYGQGAAAEIVAFGTIEAADLLGLPVSTTHILSSGIAGTMVANGSGVQGPTVRNIILAWVLTLPVCVLLGAALFGAGLLFVFRVLGVH